jgi:fatty acid desaturase
MVAGQMAFPTPPSPSDPSDPTERSADDSSRKDATRRIAVRTALWGLPIAAIALLCLALGVPWWLVAGCIVVFAAIIVFEI